MTLSVQANGLYLWEIPICAMVKSLITYGIVQHTCNKLYAKGCFLPMHIVRIGFCKIASDSFEFIGIFVFSPTPT